MSRQLGGPEQPRRRSELGVNERLVETDQATFIVNYSFHTIEIPGETVGDNLNAVLIELDLGRDIDHPGVKLWLGSVLRAAKEKGLPVFLVDMDTGQMSNQWLMNRLAQLMGVGLMAGAAYDTFLTKVIAGEKVPRRRVLGRTLAFITGAYLVIPSFVEETKPEYSKIPNSYEEPIEELDNPKVPAIRRFNEATRPDWLRKDEEVPLRDAVIAQKAAIVAFLMNEKASEKPTLKLYVGASHTGVAEDLRKTPEERLDKIEKLRYSYKTGPIVRIDFVKEEGEEKMKITIIEETGIQE